MLTKDQLKELNFTETPEGYFKYKLGKYKSLSIESLGLQNEIIKIYFIDENNEEKFTDIVTLNYVKSAGNITLERINELIKLLT